MNNSQIDYIKSAINPADFYKHELPGIRIIKPGWNDAGICVFHTDTKPGSFFINIETGAFKCFDCGATGDDVIAFTMMQYGISFTEALQQLTDEWEL